MCPKKSRVHLDPLAADKRDRESPHRPTVDTHQKGGTTHSDRWAEDRCWAEDRDSGRPSAGRARWEGRERSGLPTAGTPCLEGTSRSGRSAAGRAHSGGRACWGPTDTARGDRTRSHLPPGTGSPGRRQADTRKNWGDNRMLQAEEQRPRRPLHRTDCTPRPRRSAQFYRLHPAFYKPPDLQITPAGERHIVRRAVLLARRIV